MGQPVGERVLIVGAHPDDETIGAGGVLASIPECQVLMVTDGAPRTHAGRAQYRAARREELLKAMSLAGIPEDRVASLDVVDQETSFTLRDLTYRLLEWIETWRPATVLVHAYEGGHPDHDSAAFAVHGAIRLLRMREAQVPEIVEYASYHNGEPYADPVYLNVGRFLPGGEERVIPLDASEAERKRRMFNCYVTQRQMLENFPVQVERFRPAPAYDFSAPPHQGRLFYEAQDWGMTGSAWRSLAQKALIELNLQKD